MAAIHGKDGKIADGTGDVGLLDTWTLNIAHDPAEITDFGDDWRAFLAGLVGATGSAEGNWDVENDAAQGRLQAATLTPASVTLKLYVNGSNYYTGSAFITSIRTTAPVQGKVTVGFDFTFTGAVSYT